MDLMSSVDKICPAVAIEVLYMEALEGRIFPLRICSIDVNFREIYMKVPAVIDCHMTKWANPTA